MSLCAGAITDEFSADLEVALNSMRELGMEAAELRMVFGRNIIDLSDEEIEKAGALVKQYGMKTVAIASPLLKCTLPDAPAVDGRFQQDMFAAKHSFEDQPRLTERAFVIAERLGVKIIRVFSYWRVVEPGRVFDRVVAALGALGKQAGERGLIVGLENEHACNIATAGEAASALAQISSPHVRLVWDPANAYVSGENAFPDGYAKVPIKRIVHVHAKDCTMAAGEPVWCELGAGNVDWQGQIAALKRNGYEGCVNLETHWAGPNSGDKNGDKLQASMICGRNLVEITRG